ncbi:hypothetical protein Halru_1217 [Halovivax ruber XH-70]|uniref:Uncharacterized protein n=1 Tax=Halovivax ruber (strain DSM 18193 / JCM 13892 / XH-70) TaxID=797302 RepID=L0ID15_HALRX|nr:DUF5791 family protein [Halovivax ruber]AGB15832.1 hypothetical protein Halru_1217 [Halovivax ruber XH-70]
MFAELRTEVPASPAALRAEYDRELAAIVESVGLDQAVAETDVNRDDLQTLLDGDSPPISLTDATAIAALDPDQPDAESIEIEACEHLLLGMTTAVLDVERLAIELDLDLDPTEIQQKIERRAPMSFAEFVHIQHTIAEQSP